jgi:hypothetical protein
MTRHDRERIALESNKSFRCRVKILMICASVVLVALVLLFLHREGIIMAAVSVDKNLTATAPLPFEWGFSLQHDSPAIGMGSPVDAPPLDYFGNPRKNPGSMGAIEYYPTYVYFEYGETATYGQTTPKQPMENYGNFSYAVTGLQPNTIYHYRAVAEMGPNWKGYGLDMTFKTLNPADVNQDGVVNVIDLSLVSQAFGTAGTNGTDVNGDGIVNVLDLLLVAQGF